MFGIAEVLVAIVTTLIGIFVSLVVYARWNYGKLEAMGIPVVKPHWLLGSNFNYMELYHHWEDLHRSKKLGPVYGVYSGREPEVFVTDLEMLHRIFFKDSDHFYNRRPQDMGHPTINEAIEVQNGEKWKVERAILTPLFTPAKLKMISDPVQRLSEEYVDVLKKDVDFNGGRLKIEFQQFLKPFAIEVIAECLCGIKLEDARNPDNTFVKSMRAAIWEDITLDWTYNISVVFPFIQRLVPAFPSDGLHFLESAVKSILDEREKSERNIPDTVNALLEMRKKLNTEEWKRMGMNIHSVYGQAFEFFIASYFGIHCTISYLSYHLATNPEVARRVQEEVDAFLKEEEKVKYETLSKKLPYLTACFYETWRKTPGFFRLDRVCTKDWDFKGYSIKKGTIVIVPIYPIHHNPDIYPEPEKFEPERFLPGNKEQLDPCAFLQFGLGHRQCIGVKYVVEILKSFMVRVLRNFEIQRRDDTVWKEHPGNHFTLQLDPIFVDLVKRSN